MRAVQESCFASGVSGALSATEGVIANGIISHEVCGAILSSWRILVGHPWLYDFLQAFALRGQFVHGLVLHLECVLEIIDHPLLNLL